MEMVLTGYDRAGNRFLSRRGFGKGKDIKVFVCGWNFGRGTKEKRKERSGKRQISDPGSVKTLKGSR